MKGKPLSADCITLNTIRKFVQNLVQAYAKYARNDVLHMLSNELASNYIILHSWASSVSTITALSSLIQLAEVLFANRHNDITEAFIPLVDLIHYRHYRNDQPSAGEALG